MTNENSSLDAFKQKIEQAVSLVSSMSAEEKLKAVQLWNVLSEKLQEIVNNSAADINALTFQENQPNVQNYFYYPSPPSKSSHPQTDTCPTSIPMLHANPKSPLQHAIEVDNSLASFSDIQCADDESIHMDGVCPIELPSSIESGLELSFPENALPESDMEKVVKQFDCSECGLAFRTKGHLLDHSRKHTGERPFLCSQCGNSFTTSSNLKRHVKSHVGEKTWSCLICHDKFLEKKTMLVHMRRHTGEKPYECVTCKKRFSQLSILQSHTASHTDLRCHLCELCGKAFRQKSQMKIHLMRHKGDEVKKFSCKDCPMSFLTSSDYRRHVRVHTGERPFPCEQCGKSFTRLETLNDHKNRHKGLKPYICKICGKAFSEASSYGKHIRKHDNNSSSPLNKV